MKLILNATQQAIMKHRSLEKFTIYVSRQIGKTVLVQQYFLRRERLKKAERALSRFKLNSSYFMYRNVNGAWRNF